MAKGKKLSELELLLKKISQLAKMYTDFKLEDGSVNIIEKATPNSGYLKTYIFANGVNEESKVVKEGAGKNFIGEIDIPKDFMLKSKKLLTVEDGKDANLGKLMVVKEDNVAVSEYEAPTAITSKGQWLDLVVNTADDSETAKHTYIDLSLFADIYTAGNGLVLNGKEFSISINTGSANGLSITSDGLGLSLAIASTNGTGGSAGAMSAQDKEKIDKLGVDLLTDAELASWFGYDITGTPAVGSEDAAVKSALESVSDDSITDED